MKLKPRTLQIITFLCGAALLSLLYVACDDDATRDEDCAAVICLARPTFGIVPVNDQGTNLLTNGTYDLATIMVSRNGTSLVDGRNANDTVIVFSVSGEEGANSYLVQLNETKTDTLGLNLEVIDSGSACCGPEINILDASYNGTAQEIRADAMPIITVTIPQN